MLPGDEGKETLQELVGNELVVMDNVFQMLSASLSMRVEIVGPRQIEAGGVNGSKDIHKTSHQGIVGTSFPTFTAAIHGLPNITAPYIS